MRPRLFAFLLTSLVGCGVDVGAEDPATALSLEGRMTPGGLLIGEAPPGSQVSVDGRFIRVSDDGRFVFGIGRNAEGEVAVVVEPPAGEAIRRTVAIDKRDYETQRIDGLPPRKVEPNKDDQAKIEADWIMLNEAKGTDSAILAFADEAVWPVLGPVSGVFGSQRILNGKPKSPHRGVDVAAPEGTPVGAMMDGVVTVAADDMYYTGGTVMVDHGHGIQSLYAHLSAVEVDVGQTLAKGEQLGRIGATGRATGPHLHLSLYWFMTALDPALVLGPMPEPEKKETAGTQ
ncbi:MAG: M23 family metallopeptidase [Alphaproteobacteria bacterium]|nr:M23 family metallopeptidase [Alphaproteobacteria bacterium]